MPVFITDNHKENNRQLSGSMLILAFIFFAVFLLSYSCDAVYAKRELKAKGQVTVNRHLDGTIFEVSK